MIRTLLRNTCGSAGIEMLLVLPPLIFLGMAGLELTNRMLAQRAVIEIAQTLADNASRAGDSSALGRVPLRESDINDVFAGGRLQGRSIDIDNNGRIILSSLEQDASGRQIIRWRRCAGAAAAGSEYSNISNVPTRDPRGINMRGEWITAPPNDAVMIVEVYYDYAPIIPLDLIGYGEQRIAANAARLVRDNRDLSGIKGDARAARCTTSTAQPQRGAGAG